MTPTPPLNSSFQSHFRLRRSRHSVPYEEPQNTNLTTVAQTQPPITPLPDDNVDDGEGLDHEDVDLDEQGEGVDEGEDQAEAEAEAEDEDDGASNIEGEGQEGEDEEGGIEEVIREPREIVTLGGQPRFVDDTRPSHQRPIAITEEEDTATWRARMLELTDSDSRLRIVPMDIDVLFDPAALGLKEIGNLASWTVSSCKPGCGVEALRDEDTGVFWQSDGPQPHHLNIHFSRLVSILSIRIFLDFEADESYTPTRITLLAGTGYHDLIPFSTLEFTQPKGWIDVPLDNVGGGEDGKTLRAFLVQVKIVENHQNGKDTHVRGLKVYARDERTAGRAMEMEGLRKKKGKIGNREREVGSGMEARHWLAEPDWMGEPELR